MQDTVDVRPTREISLETECIRYSEEGWSQTISCVPIEKELAININFKEFVTYIGAHLLKLNSLCYWFFVF